MDQDQWFAEEFERHRRAFLEEGNFAEVMKAVRLATENELPLPKWLADVVVEMVDREFARKGSIGRGQGGNWGRKYELLMADKIRVQHCRLHFGFRQRRGRGYVSGMAPIYGYGTPIEGEKVNWVRPDDIFDFVSKELRGKPGRGAPGVIEKAWKKAQSKRRTSGSE